MNSRRHRQAITQSYFSPPSAGPLALDPLGPELSDGSREGEPGGGSMSGGGGDVSLFVTTELVVPVFGRVLRSAC